MQIKRIMWKKEGLSANIPSLIKPFSKHNIHLSNNHAFGKPRPIKHYRKGRISTNDKMIVRSNTVATVGNMIDNPGGFVQNTKIKHGSCTLVANHYPNLNNKTDKPDCKIETTKMFNAEDKAKRRVRSGPTIVKHNYYQRLQEYRTARCNTFDQKSFHFDETNENSYNKGELMGRCQNVIIKYDEFGISNIKTNGCANVSYKPSNEKYAINTATESSTRTLDIKKNSINRTHQTYKTISNGKPVKGIFIKKNKEPVCNASIINRHKQNKTICVM